MISELLAMIDDLQGELFFYVENGPLKNRLLESYSEEEDAHAEILEFEHNASLRIKRGEGAAPPVFACRLETSDFQYQIDFLAADFATEEISELLDLLRPLCPFAPDKVARPGRNILRKKQDNRLLNIAAAAKALGLSPRALKKLIPCSEVRIAEKMGAKAIKEYYWDATLVDRFTSLAAKQNKGRGYTREDLTFIAENCCDGDRQWARDCIAGFLQQHNLS